MEKGNGKMSGKRYMVSATSNDPLMGTATLSVLKYPEITDYTQYNQHYSNFSTHGIKGYPKGTVLHLEAKVRDNCRFVSWSDGVEAASRNVTVLGNKHYVALFEKEGLQNDPDDVKIPVTQSRSMELLKKWWWAIVIIALMLFDLKGGKL